MKHTPQLRDNENGFSLIEVMIGVFVLAVILTALHGGLLHTVATLNEARFRAQAVDVASSCLDEFRQARELGWVQFRQGGVGYIGSVSCSLPGNQSVSLGGTATFQGQRQVQSGTGSGGNYRIRVLQVGTTNSDQITVRVEVDWLRFRGDDRANDWNNYSYFERAIGVEQTFFRRDYELYW
ncbi:MAG: prepilin-type N-terminal cleavage/methylation domain-containing protein [Pseudomonadales bacterium]|jgi:prepilin-type N-terminal cleavage/methylation domain-containing protein|nr:prepilin-type N-terminal cleavage/methylation domain-containing protein [Pseudomonadales bacterium]